MRDDTILQRIYAPENRPDPYPLLAELRLRPVSWQKGGWTPDGSYVISSYDATSALLRDPRISQDGRAIDGTEPNATPSLSFIELDPPEHDRVRAMAMKHFGPPMRADYVHNLRPAIERSVAALIDRLGREEEIDIVKSVSYPLPVKLICEILGVPPEDQEQFHIWVDDFIESDDAPENRAAALQSLYDFMAELVRLRRENPQDDLISRMATDTGPDGRLEDPYIISTAMVLLIGGHETTANTISNGMLLFLRNPDILRRVQEQPEYIVSAVEELLRFEPPVQFLIRRFALDEITIAGSTIPKGANITLSIAGANRDPAKFKDPDRFDPARPDNTHLGFGSGVHFCFGAPLARLEAQIALRELARRMVGPKLVRDPVYRPSAVLRGIHELPVAASGIRD